MIRLFDGPIAPAPPRDERPAPRTRHLIVRGQCEACGHRQLAVVYADGQLYDMQCEACAEMCLQCDGPYLEVPDDHQISVGVKCNDVLTWLTSSLDRKFQH